MRFLILILFTLLYISPIKAQPWEVNILADINPETPKQFWKATSNSTYFISVGVPSVQLLSGILQKDKTLQKKGLQTLGAMAINTAIVQALKKTTDRERPAFAYPNLIYTNSTERGESFPSGHVSTAFAVATSLSLEHKKWYITAPAFVWAGCVGYSRMHVGEHYPSDVAAGAIIGAGSAYLSHWLTKKLFSSK
ncbi:MAG: phosphatase PAP2 family protein [Chitinophagaceae bacterium]